MIDFYYQFPEDTCISDRSIRFALQRGYHPEYSLIDQKLLHSQAYDKAIRIWAENANGITLIRENGRDVHRKESTEHTIWLKLQAYELD